MLDFLDGLPPLLEFIVLLAAVMAAIIAIHQALYLPIKRHFDRVNAGMDTLLGYPEVTDPGSGRVIQPPTPPLAQRVYDLEETNRSMAASLEVLADNQRRIVQLEESWDERNRIGQAILTDFTEWREQVDAALHQWVAEQDQLAALLREYTQKEIDKKEDQG